MGGSEGGAHARPMDSQPVLLAILERRLDEPVFRISRQSAIRQGLPMSSAPPVATAPSAYCSSGATIW